MPWQLGNTTLRNPYRLREGLQLLDSLGWPVSIRGAVQEQRFALRLYEASIVEPTADTAPQVEAARANPDTPIAEIPTLGRKWRRALEQLGFIWEGEDGYRITPNGIRLLAAIGTVQSQNCFFRAIWAFRPDSPEHDFSPLKLVVSVLLELGARGEEARISDKEMALFVQNASSNASVNAAVDDIIRLRQQLGTAANNRERSQVLEQFFAEARERFGYSQDTLEAYGDMNLRYLRTTGLFVRTGRGIALDGNATAVAEFIAAQPIHALSEDEYLRQLREGAQLPTDDRVRAIRLIESLREQLAAAGEPVPPVVADGLTAAQLEDVRLSLLERLNRRSERNYAHDQARRIPEIVAWLRAVQTNTPQTLEDGTRISVPSSERPAFLEWAVWRAFLALNELLGEPWQSRRFEIDNEFWPTGTAPGGGPDLQFAFQEMLLVVEVTLTNNSRQEAAEGEPVRRHVANLHGETREGQRLFGLFIAPTIDSNTANTFRMGEWYFPGDRRVNVHIVPMTLSDFITMLECALVNRGGVRRGLFDLLARCRGWAAEPAPEWKTKISEEVASYCRSVRAAV